MQLLYIHGLNSEGNSLKGQQLSRFCQCHFPHIRVVSPDLNIPPAQALELLTAIVQQDKETALVGLSLGGFFATLLHQHLPCKTVLLNPSIYPAQSLRRFFPANFDDLPPDFVGYTTPNGWQVTKANLLWFAQQSLTPLNRPENMMVILKQGDDLLDYRVSEHYFRQQQVANIIVEADGDHRMSDFFIKIPQVIHFLFGLNMPYE